jgi:hypothetical protein|nr:MAG TPA: hypothetical protein [Caudoviricetes sp.]
MEWIVIGIVSLASFGFSMLAMDKGVEYRQPQTEIYQEVNQPKSKEDFQKLDLVQTTNELESNRFRNYWYRLKNASERPKRFVVENDEGDRIEFTVKKSYKIYIEND